jgi:hypothetical protein
MWLKILIWFIFVKFLLAEPCGFEGEMDKNSLMAILMF